MLISWDYTSTTIYHSWRATFFRPGRGGYAVGVHVMVLVDRQWLPGKARSPKSKLCPVGLWTLCMDHPKNRFFVWFWTSRANTGTTQSTIVEEMWDRAWLVCWSVLIFPHKKGLSILWRGILKMQREGTLKRLVSFSRLSLSALTNDERIEFLTIWTLEE